MPSEATKAFKAFQNRDGKSVAKHPPPSPTNLGLIRDAVARIWPLFKKAPSPFPGYGAAERYLANRLSSQRFDYGINADATTEHVWCVTGRVHKEFIREAEKSGLFIIDREQEAGPTRYTSSGSYPNPGAQNQH